MDPPPGPPSTLGDAPDAEKMEQIRKRRMEKLAATTSEPAQTSTASSTSSPAPPVEAAATPIAPAAPTAKPKINVMKVVNTQQPDVENPFRQLGMQSGTNGAVMGQNAPETARKPTIPASDESIEDWESRILGQIFRVTLDPMQTTDATGHKLMLLPELREQMVHEGVEMRLSIDRLDAALMEAGATIPHDKPVLEYLLPCWKRVNKALRALKGYVNAKDSILREAKRLCMSNCIFATEMPEFFQREANPATDLLTPFLLHEPGEDRGICIDFMSEAVLRFEDDDMAKQMVVNAIVGLSTDLSKLSMNDNYKPYIKALKFCASHKPIAIIAAQHPRFQMAVSAPNIEKMTILGPLFHLSPLQAQVTKEYFSSPRTLHKSHIQTAQEALRLTLQAHQRDLLDIANHFIKAGEISRNKTLDWFAYIVNTNHKRRALRFDPNEVSTDGFMMNVTVVLDGLCEPFMDTTFTKVSRIEVEYFRRKPRIDIKEETKLNADQQASDDFYAHEAGGTSNFITEIFFLTLAMHHYGSEATNSMLKNLDKDIKHFEKQIQEIENERQKVQNNPMQLRMIDLHIQRYQAVLEKSLSLKYATAGVLLDKQMQTKSVLFMRYVTVWLLRIATGTDFTPDKAIKLPLDARQPEAFKFLPEYVLEDIVSNFNFIFQFIPDVMISAIGDEIIVLCVTFLTNSEYIKNPYLKAKLVSLLFHGTWPVYHRTKGILGDALTSSDFANNYLLHALIKFYTEVESTGAHTQFYDKFNIRYEIFQVIKCIWSNDVYEKRMRQESRTNTEFFLRFVNLLLNDATYVLDEALGKFPKIHDLQLELQPRNHGDTRPELTPEERTAKEEELASAENQAQSYMQLTNETISMMRLFTSSLSASFTMAEIVDRVAAMVDYTLDTLVGPKSANLKVADPGKYKFAPRNLLSEFVDIYLNLSVSEAFVAAVARDGRSYKPVNFDNASRILQRFNLRSSEDIAKWEKLKQRFKEAKETEDQLDEDLGEIPDELLDPLMYSLMEDPVILPISKVTLDRGTIRSHLLSDPHDPFNRTPLKIEDVVDDTDMKARIDAFKKERRDLARAARASTTIKSEDVTMTDMAPS